MSRRSTLPPKYEEVTSAAAASRSPASAPPSSSRIELEEAHLAVRDGSDMQILAHPQRITVEFGISFHAFSFRSQEELAKLHLVLKFWYKYDDMHYFMSDHDIPRPDVTFLKTYGDRNNGRFFPYVIFNAVDENIVNWSYTKDKENRVYERIELDANVTHVVFDKYFPFVMKLIHVKVGTDGLHKTKYINLVPKRDHGNGGKLDFDWGIFQGDTTRLYIPKVMVTSANAVQSAQSGGGGDKKYSFSVNEEHSNVFCKTYVRDLRGVSDGNIAGLYSRVYVCVFSESPWFGHFFKFIVVSTLILYIQVFAVDENDLENNITLILTQVAMLFVLPPNEEFFTAEKILTLHTFAMIASTLFIQLEFVSEGHLISYFKLFITVLSMVIAVQDKRSYDRLVTAIRKHFYANGRAIGSFADIDNII